MDLDDEDGSESGGPGDDEGDRDLKVELEELYKRTDAALSLLSFHDRVSKLNSL